MPKEAGRAVHAVEGQDKLAVAVAAKRIPAALAVPSQLLVLVDLSDDDRVDLFICAVQWLGSRRGRVVDGESAMSETNRGLIVHPHITAVRSSMPDQLERPFKLPAKSRPSVALPSFRRLGPSRRRIGSRGVSVHSNETTHRCRMGWLEDNLWIFCGSVVCRTCVTKLAGVLAEGETRAL